MSGDGQALRTDKLTLQTILQHGLCGVRASASRCRTTCGEPSGRSWRVAPPCSGGHVQACPEGHVERVWYNSCRHRMCPQCAWLQVERWLARQKARLLACEHYHVIFTMPARAQRALAGQRRRDDPAAVCERARRRCLSCWAMRSIWGPSPASSPRCTPGARRCSCIRTSIVW